MIAVGLQFHENGTLMKHRTKTIKLTKWQSHFLLYISKRFQTHLARSAVISCKPGCFPNTQNIHPVHLDTNTISTFSWNYYGPPSEKTLHYFIIHSLHFFYTAILWCCNNRYNVETDKFKKKKKAVQRYRNNIKGFKTEYDSTRRPGMKSPLL